MAYTKTTWAAGDTVTSQKLNKIENQLETLSNGGGAGCFVVNITPDTSGGSTPIKGGNNTKSGNNTVYITDKTYNQIVDAFQSGSLPIGIVHETAPDSPGGGTRGANDQPEFWMHWIFIGASAEYADNNMLEYIAIFASFTDMSGPVYFYTTDPDSTLITEEPGSGSGGATV